MRTEYRCPVEATIDVIGGKWKPLILYYLFAEPRRFGQLRRDIPQATQQMLTQHLRELEADGVVRRTVYAAVPPHVEYAVTPFGYTLEPLMHQMLAWGEAYLAQAADAVHASE